MLRELPGGGMGEGPGMCMHGCAAALLCECLAAPTSCAPPTRAACPAARHQAIKRARVLTPPLLLADPVQDGVPPLRQAAGQCDWRPHAPQ
jgi:hypothetical protein